MNKEEMIIKIQAKKQQRDQALTAAKIAEAEKLNQDIAKLKTYATRIKDLVDVAEAIRKNGFYKYIENYGAPSSRCLGFFTSNSSLPIEFLIIGGCSYTYEPEIRIYADGTCEAFSGHSSSPDKVKNNQLNPFFVQFDTFEKEIYKIVNDCF